MSASVPLASLVDSLLQKAYHDLTVLQELLPRKSDADRKLEIVQYARCTRALVIRLLALVKWAGSSNSVQKCSEMSDLLNQQSQLYISTADQLVELARNVLVRACTPNFSLAPALDVLSTGSYPRLPTCIKERIIPPLPLTDGEKTTAYSLIDVAIRRRLVTETVPSNMTVKSISKGVVTFVVPYEFEVKLSVVSDDLTTPWRLISLKILVGEGLPGNPILMHDFQMFYLHQLVQSRLYAEDNPLVDCYNCLHTFCLALQLDCLHSQALRLSSEVYGGYVKVEEYSHGHHMKMVYWRPGSDQLLSAFLLDTSETSWPKLIISVDPQQRSDKPFLTTHYPPLPAGSEVNLLASNLSLEELLKKCVVERSHTHLRELKNVLSGTGWHKHAALRDEPMSLCVHMPLKYGTRDVVLCVDTRVGHITATIEPPCQVGRVSSFVEELEKAVTSNKSALSLHLNKLQCHLFLANLAESVTELGYKVEWSLPLVSPLPFHIAAVVFIELQPLTHLIVGINEGLVDQYHLIKLMSVSSQPSFQQQAIVSTPGESPPKSFLTIQNLIELDPDEICFEHLKSVLLNEKGPMLKRRLRESKLELPSLKRLCVRDSPLFTPLPGLVKARMTLLNMQTSLNASKIPHCAMYTAQGTPCINIFEFPLEQLQHESRDVHDLLSSHLQSCQLVHSGTGFTCTFIFRAMLECSRSGSSEILLHQTIPEHPSSPSSSSSLPYGDLGQSLLAQWTAWLALLGLTLELQHYLENSSSPLKHLCSITSFTYDKVSVMFGNHTLTVEGRPGSLYLSFSSGCPHAVLREHLETFLNSSRSLPLLLQGLTATEKTMEVLSNFVSSLPNTDAVSVSTVSPPQVQLKYNNFVLTMSLQADSTVLITDLSYNPAGITTMTVPLSNTLNYLQEFLHYTIYGTSLADSEETMSLQPSVPQAAVPMPKRTLYPVPSPIASPRPGHMWPGSPSNYAVPSIPPMSVPSPKHGASGIRTGRGGWECELTLEQFKQLLTPPTTPPTNLDGYPDDCSPLEVFLGSLSLLYQFANHVSKFQAGQQTPVPINFVQCDRGVYTYRTENLSMTLGLEGPLLTLSLKPQRENVWAQDDLDTLSRFFKKEVMCRPFLLMGISSFIQLILLPLVCLKSCVQLLRHQLNPSPTAHWRFSICLTVPPGNDVGGTPFVAGSAAIVYGRGKLLLFLRLEQTQGNTNFVLPLMHDPRTNITYVARFQNQYRSPLHPPIDTILRKSSQDINNSAGHAGHPGPAPSSLCPAILLLSQSPLPV